MSKTSSEKRSPIARLNWLAVPSLGVLAILAIALSACGGSDGGEEASAATAGSASQSAPTSESVKLVIKSDEEQGKKGADGQWHDAFLPADFSVEAGATVKVTVYNYDDMPHSFTSAGLDTNAKIPSGTEEKASKTTFTFKAPDKAGSYEWICAVPCDPWSMAHNGFMKGHVTVT
jgi:plastocyanin